MPVILRSSYSDSVSLDLVQAGILVVVKWKDGYTTKLLSNQELLGHTLASQPAVLKRPCYWARQIIIAVLESRGV